MAPACDEFPVWLSLPCPVEVPAGIAVVNGSERDPVEPVGSEMVEGTGAVDSGPPAARASVGSNPVPI